MKNVNVINPGIKPVNNASSKLKAISLYLDSKFPIISVMPTVILIFLVIAYPVGYLVYLSFTDTSNLNLISGGAVFVGLSNYIEHFKDPSFIRSVWQTLYFAFTSVIFQFIIGVVLAYLVFPMGKRLKNVLIALVLVPSVVSETASSLILKPMLDNQTGIFNFILTSLGLPAVNFLGDMTIAQFVVIIMNIWQWVPYMFVLLLSGMETLSVSYFEVAHLEGASHFQRLWYIILPLVKPVALVAAFFRLTSALRLFDKIYILTGGGAGTETITSYIQRVGTSRMEFGFSSAGGVIMLLITAIFGLIALKYMYDTNY